MDGHIEQQIRRRAYELWVEGGMQDGRDADHWHRAEHEMTLCHEHVAPKKPARAKKAAVAAPKKPARRKLASA